ncbi:helicase-related protein [Parvibaculum sp.]|uniref:helicase-related protein n=1 Tax=Parvibaculum sp. TaxID=2024848 RepID=UPI002BFFD52D|nr:helicase-related protein [Parvibaculum sp.]HUD51956.1 helicase-related protein [Parvibaculum sp.]
MSSVPLPQHPAGGLPRRITAVLGPTNTGKTHLAIERMMAHETGMIGLPLRLLAREVYDRVVKVKGVATVALITGEEKILPASARYFICTVEAMPLEREVQFLAVDEIQLAADRERGHTFTDRLLRARGLSETMMLGSETVRALIQKLLPDTIFVSRPRFSELSWTGPKKLTRLPRRSAIVAFSADQVYAIAELIRRQRGGAAVVMGALSPRTRNAQVALYQSGDVDFLVATDAIGMGLNMDVDHVAFAATSKFDGHFHRPLRVSELAQIAGRAGRHMNNGTFGVTGEAAPLAQDTIERIENHVFDAEHVLQWRNPHLEFGSVAALVKSLERSPERPGLTRAQSGDDGEALARMVLDEEVARIARAPAAIRRLWDVAQVPDFRKTLASEHAGLLTRIYLFLMGDSGKISEDWLAGQLARVDRTDGDIDTLATRIAHVRTWTYVSNRADWLQNPAHWQERTREIEDKLSDALHERLTQRFIDRRTSVLMKRLRQNEDLMAAVNSDGEVLVEGEYVGRLQGFVFVPDLKAEGVHGSVLRAASEPVIALEIAARAARLAAAPDSDIHLSEHGRLIWDASPIAELKASDNSLTPRIELLAGEELQGPSRESVTQRLDAWLKAHVASVLAPLVTLRDAEDVTGLARGIAFRLVENFGSLRREKVAEDIRALDQAARGLLRKYGVRFGSYSIFMPALLKPAPARLLLTLWALARKDVPKEAENHFIDLPQPPTPGLTSVPGDTNAPMGFYDALGFRLCGGRAVRIDMLERIADLIRPVIADRSYNGGFIVTPAMMSLVGCSGEEFSNLLKGLGYRPRLEKVKPPKPAAEKPIASTTPVIVVVKNSGAEHKPEPAETAPAPQEAVEPTPERVVEENAPAVETPPEVAADASVPTEAPAEASAPAGEAAEATPADTTGGTMASDATIGDATAVAPVAEDELVELEIWRPIRRQKPETRPRRERAKAEGAEAGTASDAQSRRERYRPNREKPKDGEAGGEKRADARPDNRGKRNERQGDRQGGDRPHGKPRHGSKDRDERHGGKSGGKGPERREYSSKPPRREREIDPDSPFAALAVLKERVRSN